jgi:hypothetical protein
MRSTGEDSLPQCQYVYNGQPDCIVGRFLASQGVPLERLAKADTSTFGGSTAAVTLLTQLRSEGFITYGDYVCTVLGQVQYSQDQGQPWGDAVDDALARAGR